MTIIDTFDKLALAFEGWPDPWPVQAGALSDPQRRLLDALTDAANEPASAGFPDIAALARQVLRGEELSRGKSIPLPLPSHPDLRVKETWRRAGLQVARGHGGGLLWPEPWLPAWLPGHGGTDLAEDAFAAGISENRRRIEALVPADPFWSAVIGRDSYLSPGQRQAARAAMASQPGATLVVNLPTGSGKSAVALAPALLWSSRVGVSVIVVPTTALALDQERALTQLLSSTSTTPIPPRFAYYGGQADEEREGIRRGIRDGSQRVVFSSPESLMGSLAPSLSMAAANDLLRIFGVDEAHLVAQWGDEFRPEFQAIAGLRLDLLRRARAAGHSPFRTILMTGTLTADSLQTIHTLFGRPGPFDAISAVELRPEPSYWVAHCRDERERDQRILEAVAHLPRPMILYTTLVAEARRLKRMLEEQGYRRLRLVTGRSSSDDRLSAIHDLRRDVGEGGHTSVDMIVATSAFGLGVDYAGIRTIIHACVPETADRFYQEVGRGGRDGYASVSLLLHTSDDRSAAERLNRRTIISIKRGRERWETMHRARTAGPDELGDGVLRLDLRRHPPDLPGDNRANQAWNLRTLSLMSRAGLIELESEAPPMQGEDESDEDWDARRDKEFEQYYSTVVVRLLRGDLADPSVWDELVAPERNETASADRRSLELMYQVLSQTRDHADIFSDAYSIHSGPPLPSELEGVIPQKACGGCPACRTGSREPRAAVAPEPLPIQHPLVEMADWIDSRFLGEQVLTVFTSESPGRRWLQECRRMVKRCVEAGFRILISQAPEVLMDTEIRNVWRGISDRFLVMDAELRPLHHPDLPTIIVYPPSREEVADRIHYRASSSRRAKRIILAHQTLRDYERPESPLADFRLPHMTVDEFLRGR